MISLSNITPLVWLRFSRWLATNHKRRASTLLLFQPPNQCTGIVLTHAVVLASLPQCFWWETAGQHQVRFGRYEMSVPSNPVASGLRAGWTATISLTCHVLRHTAVVWSVSPPSRLDERMRHASRPGWWSHNETDRGGATAPRKGSKHFNPD